MGYKLTAQSTFIQFGDSVQGWINKRVENAKNGVKEQVKMPFVVRTTGWGCTCPKYYIGTDPLSGTGFWLMPITPKKFPVSDSLGHSLIVEGYFTGKMMKFAGDDNDVLLVPQFKITSWQANESGDNTDAPEVLK